jgi:predicted DNA-binding protein
VRTRAVLHSGVPIKRDRPQVSATLEFETHERVRTLVEQLPGATLSGVLNELIEASLPIYEDMAAAMLAAKRPDGSMDERKAKRDVSARVAARLVRATLGDDDEAGDEAS